ncbi:unnamed protein product [Symbiodinium microadriaticum]|nr:unnamed protein product [Symbiodinium microadriaticum]
MVRRKECFSIGLHLVAASLGPVRREHGEDLSQYTAILDLAKVPIQLQTKAERLARKIEFRHSTQGKRCNKQASFCCLRTMCLLDRNRRSFASCCCPDAVVRVLRATT